MTTTAASAASEQPDATVDTVDVARFTALAAQWWDPYGPFKPLHRLNPIRVAYLRDWICAVHGREPTAARPLAGLTALDIGCGGGLLCEPLTRLGATVAGIDASPQSVTVARLHAESMGLRIDYRCTPVAALADAGQQFDIVLAMEVVEHVVDVGAFLRAAAAVLRPGGILALATLNRTPQAFVLAIVGAEYLLRWLPRGTHHWRRFLRPAELAAHLRPAGLAFADLTGVVYAPFQRVWRLDAKDLAVNYMGIVTTDRKIPSVKKDSVQKEEV